tara:strand:+ start:28 stop:276 length:249 start_codon:yes stop_codon:yes gene_type:complete
MFGWVAGGLSALHNVPQIVHICRRESAADVSWAALFVRMLSLGFYIAHGVTIEDLPLVVMSGVIVLQCCIISVQKWWFSTKV